MRRFKRYFIFGMFSFSIVMLIGCDCCPRNSVTDNSNYGFQGKSYERNSDGSIGSVISGVIITFVKEDGSEIKKIVTDNSGSYRVSLNTGRYWVTATHKDYEDSSSLPGYFVVTGSGYQTGNIFLRKPRVTTILLVRHAERADDSLNQAGLERAQKLTHIAFKAGVTAVYTTGYNRTQQTVQPLADILNIEPITYDSVDGLVNQVLSYNSGDVVLVAGHSNTVPSIAREFGAMDISTAYIEDFDNLLVVTRRSDGENVDVNVLNLQYGEPSLPDSEKRSSCHMTTLLLLRHTEPGSTGVARAEKLAHVAAKLKTETTTIFTDSSPDTVQPLANELDLQIYNYNPADLQGFTDQILLEHDGEVVVIAGENNVLSEIIRKLGGSPFPPTFSYEYDNLFVVTVYKPDDAKVVSLQYGNPSP